MSDSSTAWKSKTAIFLGSQVLSLLGTSLVQYALMWFVTLQTKSGVMMTVYIICGFIPTFLLSPFAGVWADRYDRKKLIMLSDGIIAVITLALALVFMSGQRALWLVFPADPVTAGLAIVILGVFLMVPPHRKAAEAATVAYFADLRLGLRYVREHRYLISFFGFLAVLFFLIAPAAFLTPLQVARSYGSDVWRLTSIEVAFSVGMMAGGALISVWGGLKNRIHTMLLSTFSMASLTIALGLAPAFWLYLVCMVAFGLAIPFFNAPSAVLLQDHVEQDYLGRVFSILTMISTSIMPLGMLVFGPLAEVFRIEWLLLGTGALIIVVGFLALGNRRLIEAGVKIEKPAEAQSAG